MDFEGSRVRFESWNVVFGGLCGCYILEFVQGE